MTCMKNLHMVGCLVVVLAGCSRGKPEVGPDLEISADTLIGRWRLASKDEADQKGGPPGKNPFEIYWEFKKDHKFESRGMLGNGPATWKVVEVGRNSLTLELTVKNFPARGKATFESKDKCTVIMGEGGPEEVFLLTRVP
jgi:hypothetical protein